jgi:HNH endonuclease/AP2 domain
MKQIRPIRIDGSIAYIPLTQGHEAIIDTFNVPVVESKNWFAQVNKPGVRIYAFCDDYSGFKPKKVLLHRLIMDAPTGFDVDHINHNTLDNRNANLRLATRSDNMANRAGLDANNTLGFRGLCRTPKGRYTAKIKCRGQKYHIGTYDSAEAAYAAFQIKAKELFGEFYSEVLKP